MSKTIEIDGVPHPDTRDTRTKVFDEGWRVPKRESDLPYAKEIAEAEAAAAKAKWETKLQDPNITVEERNLLRMRREQENYLDNKEREQVLNEHLESPRVSKKLAEAKAIRAAIVADPERTVAEIIAADRVIATYSDPEGDPEAADKMLRDLRTNDNNYRLDKASVYRREADKFERLFRETMSGVVEEPIRQRIRVEGVNVAERLESLIDNMGHRTGHDEADLDEAFRARRALVLQGDFAPAEAVLSKFADTSAEPPQGLATEGGDDAE